MGPVKPNGWHPNGVESSGCQNLLGFNGLNRLAQKKQRGDKDFKDFGVLFLSNTNMRTTKRLLTCFTKMLNVHN